MNAKTFLCAFAAAALFVAAAGAQGIGGAASVGAGAGVGAAGPLSPSTNTPGSASGDAGTSAGSYLGISPPECLRPNDPRCHSNGIGSTGVGAGAGAASTGALGSQSCSIGDRDCVNGSGNTRRRP